MGAVGHKEMDKNEKTKSIGSWMPSVDGLRALSCLSLVLLHTQIIAPATKHPDDPIFKTLRQHPITGIHQFLGCQVDALLLISGFLLMRAVHVKLYIDDRKSLPSPTWVATTIAKRAFRLWPTLVAVLILQIVIGDTSAQSHYGAHIWRILTFSYNYADLRTDLTLSTGPTWSICVDFQLCAIATVSLWSCRMVSSTKSTYRRLAIALLTTLFIISFLIRYIKWDVEESNLLVAFYGATFWTIMPRHIWRYIKAQYRFDPLAHPLSAGFEDDGSSPLRWGGQYMFDYGEKLYYPTGTRFGPFVLGMFLAMILENGDSCHSTPKSAEPTGLKYFLQRMGKPVCMAYCALIFISSIKSPTDNPSYIEGLVATVFLRNMFALSIAILLSMTLVPKTSLWYSPAINNFLSWRGWRAISTESYGINMLHFRILIDIVLRHFPLQDNDITFMYIWKVYVLGFSISYALAFLVRVYFEDTVRAIVFEALSPANHKLKSF